MGGDRMKEQLALDGSEYVPLTSDDWETPPEIFDLLHKKYDFTLDPCCTTQTAKCDNYFTIQEDGLKQKWFGRVFVNCPYSNIPQWLDKINHEMRRLDHPELIVALLPAWTDRDWFHDKLKNYIQIKFLRGRVKFLLNGKRRNSPKFGCMLVEWR